MRIDLTQEEIRIVRFMGKARRDNAQKFNKDKQISDQDPYQIDIDGFMGEFIVAKALNVMPDFELTAKKKDYDLIDAEGNKIDVKSSRISCREIQSHVVAGDVKVGGAFDCLRAGEI